MFEGYRSGTNKLSESVFLEGVVVDPLSRTPCRSLSGFKRAEGPSTQRGSSRRRRGAARRATPAHSVRNERVPTWRGGMPLRDTIAGRVGRDAGRDSEETSSSLSRHAVIKSPAAPLEPSFIGDYSERRLMRAHYNEPAKKARVSLCVTETPAGRIEASSSARFEYTAPTVLGRIIIIIILK